MIARHSLRNGRAAFKSASVAVDPLVARMCELMKENAGMIGEICRRAGVSHSAVQRWRHMGRDPKLSYLRAMLNAMGYDLKIVEKRGSDADN